MLHKCTAKETKGAFDLSELTGKTTPVVMRILLLIKTIQPDQSNPCTKEMVFSRNLLEKADVIC